MNVYRVSSDWGAEIGSYPCDQEANNLFALAGFSSGTSQTPAPPPPTPTNSAGKVPVGIQNLQLVWTDKATVDALYTDLFQNLPGLQWVRVDFEDADATEAANFVEQARKIHQNGGKVLAMTSITAGDVGGGSFPYSLSKLSTASFAARIRIYMDALKAAGETVEAWEIGNELDSKGFNSDDMASAVLWQSAYGPMLQTAVRTIKDPAYAAAFPNTKVITVGFANMLSYRPEIHLANPPAALAGLKNLNGQNYLEGVDGYGMHVYPGAATVESWTRQVFQQYQDAGLTDKPIWVTEWGFHRAQFPYNGTTRAQDNQHWLEYVNAYSGLTFAATFLFNYHGDGPEGGDYDIFDGNTLRQDEAKVLNNWNAAPLPAMGGTGSEGK